MSVRLVKRRFTVDEYERMGQAGILSEDDRVELIEGEIIETPPIGPPHAAITSRLLDNFATVVGTKALVRVGDPAKLDTWSMPQPDVLLAKRRDDYYASGHPEPRDILLLVEVDDTTLDYDRGVKVPLYARAGIPEVWIVALPREEIDVFRQPTAEGYCSARTFKRGDVLSIEALPRVSLTVEQVLGEAP